MGNITLEEAKEQMIANAEDGAPCPCCGRLVKLYKRKLHSEMAAFLCRLVGRWLVDPKYYSTRELCPATSKSSTDGSYLVHWGLVEKEPAQNSSGGKAGMYRPTAEGVAFAQRKTSVLSHIHMLCGDVIGFGPKRITIDQALGDKFDYYELMGLTP